MRRTEFRALGGSRVYKGAIWGQQIGNPGLIACGAAMAAMARSFSYTDGYLTWCFLLSLGSAAVAFFLYVVNLGRADHRQTYWSRIFDFAVVP